MNRNSDDEMEVDYSEQNVQKRLEPKLKTADRSRLYKTTEQKLKFLASGSHILIYQASKTATE